MTDLTRPSFVATDIEALAAHTGRLAVIVAPDGKMGPAARRANRLTKGAVQRFIDSAGFEKVKMG
ncbi:MAG: leucyl aminopeptidase, partial [Tateyamaria sp.]